jgi:hypothetical protein
LLRFFVDALMREALMRCRCRFATIPFLCRRSRRASEASDYKNAAQRSD